MLPDLAHPEWIPALLPLAALAAVALIAAGIRARRRWRARRRATSLLTRTIPGAAHSAASSNMR